VKRPDLKSHIIPLLPYLLPFWFFNRLAESWRLCQSVELVAKAVGALSKLGDVIARSPFLSFHPDDLLIGFAGAAALRLVVYFKGKNAKKYRHGVEYGSARWSA